MIRRTLRSLWREPAFTIPATVSLALGICANAAVFAIVNALWLRPLPIADPERVVVIYIPIGAQTSEKEVLDTVRWGLARRLEDARSFAEILYEGTQWDAFSEIRPTVEPTVGKGPLRVGTVGHRYFDLLGVPVKGRTFSPEHDQPATEPSAILSDHLWTSLGADARLIGATLDTTRGPLRILGVAPRGFNGIRMGADVDLWLTLGSVPLFARHPAETADFIPLTVYARLRPGVSIAEAEAEVRPLVNRRAVLRNLRDVAFPVHAESALRRQESLALILIVAAAAVLVVGCANLAALLFSRCERRRQEFAIQLALGSSRASIAREMLVEILIVGAVALPLGLLITRAVIVALGTMTLPTGLTIADLNPAFDRRVYGLAVAVAALSALIAIARPVLQMRRTDVTALLSSTGSTASPRLNMYRLVAAAHTALTVALVILAVHLSGIVLKAFWAKRGFAVDETVFVNVQPRFADYFTDPGGDLDSARLATDYSTLLLRLQSQPDVLFVSPGVPLVDLVVHETSVGVDGTEHVLPVAFLTGGPEYPQALGLTLLAGRMFAEVDRATAGVPAAIIDERLGRQLWGQDTPIGRVVSLLKRRFEVVGVVRDVHASARLDREAFLVFSVATQSATVGSSFRAVVRGRGAGSALVPQVTSAVRAVFPDPARWHVTPANDLITSKLGGERLGATIFATYGASAGALALSGLFGLALLTVTRSRKALGIRMALGARPSQLAMLVAKVALLPVVWGVLAGTVLTWTFARILQSSVPDYGGIGGLTYMVGAALYLAGALMVVTPTLRELRQLRPSEVLRAL